MSSAADVSVTAESRVRRVPILLSVFLSGATLMAVEVLAFRIIAKTFGSALRETSVVIAVFLAAMSLGYFAGGRWADRRPRVSTLSWSLVIAGATTLAIPLLDSMLAEMVFESAIPLALHSTVFTFAAFFVPPIFYASVSPMAIRLLSRDIGHTGSTAGSVSALSAIGSIIGTVATGFYLIELFQSVTRSIYFLGALIALAGIALALLHDRRVEALATRRPAAMRLVALALVAAALALLPSALDMWHRQRLESERAGAGAATFGHRVILEVDSPYHHIFVRRYNDSLNLYFDNHLQSSMSVRDPLSGSLTYTDFFHLPFILSDRVERVLFIGLGGGTVVNRFLADYPETAVDAVEIDPKVVEIAHRFFSLPERHDRLAVHVIDGRTFVKRLPPAPRFDAVVVDAYTTNRYGAVIPSHLTTREFFEELRERMTADGIVVYNSAEPRSGMISRAIIKTISEVFDHRLVFVSGPNSLIVASNEPLPQTTEALQAILARRRAENRVTLPGLERHMESMHDGSFDLLGVPVLTDDYAPVDLLTRGTEAG